VCEGGGNLDKIGDLLTFRRKVDFGLDQRSMVESKLSRRFEMLGFQEIITAIS